MTKRTITGGVVALALAGLAAVWTAQAPAAPRPQPRTADAVFSPCHTTDPYEVCGWGNP